MVCAMLSHSDELAPLSRNNIKNKPVVSRYFDTLKVRYRYRVVPRYRYRFTQPYCGRCYDLPSVESCKSAVESRAMNDGNWRWPKARVMSSLSTWWRPRATAMPSPLSPLAATWVDGRGVLQAFGGTSTG